MSDGFWAMVSVVAPVFILQIFQYITARNNAKKSEADRTEIKAQVCEVKDHINTVKIQALRSKDEVDMAHKAGQREGYVGGIEEGKKQNTGSAPLEK